jgi:glutamate synthase (NADPH/NADH) small chain
VADASGRRSVKAVPGSEFAIPCDMAIAAVGQQKAVEWLSRTFPGLVLDGGKVKTDASGRTSVRGLYAGGDCVNGGREVVNAVAEGKAAARAIDADLGHPRATASGSGEKPWPI